ncbi:GntR family transcriptional regulator [Gordonia sp. Z-3]|uniref:GntR family transcriptional regulator n=2 Tax=Gordonia TaxID=2053 RepID=A0A9X3I5M3_9ACTN|nr:MULTISPECIES: GntR family transcriptional regulator [Gordonia]MAU84277.1 GntR family transcriptional regulator [Gordonia sp. (in: high G+C Gram-positive bacteria)]MAU84821.1 GntR family transcriptional regulator [Gordonia sp. (in: high G+C Gram-positive bacteria)]MCF3937982.1 GntR family transcriptional regulator [Gordonia tangerina]MCX2965907.1 GntR family transcriptional regulator [Gordonia aquimaris]MED5800954.1 GntR family transcriptional regulator [Gordonia sp. Z-3]
MRSSATSSARPTGSEGPARSTSPRLRRRPQLSEEVAAHLREQIMTATLRPGDYVRMDETAERLGVSVTPVREALLTLRGEGMVNLAPHRGYIVAELSRTDVEDLFWLQGEIAVKLALRTADAITPEQIADLEWHNQQLRSALTSGDGSQVASAEFDFHRVHNLIASGGKLAWFLLSATRYTPAQLYATDPEWGEVAVDSHAKLIEAYRSGDRTQVVEQTRRQFVDGAARLTRHLEATGIWDEQS